MLTKDKDITKLDQAESYDDVLKHCRNKALTHRYYKFYSTEDRIMNILGKYDRPCGIYLSSGSKWNDTVDRGKFNPEDSENVNFGLCLSFSETESVAMWMLYGGMKKKGMMIDFTSTPINNIKNYKGEIELGKFINGKFESKILHKDQYEIDVFDIIYKGVKEHSNSYYRSNESITTDINMEPVNRHNLVKTYGWKYENEVRIVVSIDKGLVIDGFDTVFIPVERKDIYNKRVYYSPNFEGDRDPDFESPSYYTDKIDWDLCRGCDKR